MTQFNTEYVTSVRHWNDALFSFRTTRNPGLRFENGHFLMVGLEIDGKPLTREPLINRGRITDLIESGKLFDDIGLCPLDPDRDRAMICGSAEMLKDTANLLDRRGFKISPRVGAPGDYVIERAFVEK